MIRHPVYLIYGLLLLGLTGFAQYRGWSLQRVNEVKHVPKSVRNNPGAYRPIYAGSPRYSGGK